MLQFEVSDSVASVTHASMSFLSELGHQPNSLTGDAHKLTQASVTPTPFTRGVSHDSLMPLLFLLTQLFRAPDIAALISRLQADVDSRDTWEQELSTCICTRFLPPIRTAPPRRG